MRSKNLKNNKNNIIINKKYPLKQQLKNVWKRV
jgi:hypothetical protein